MKDRTGVSLGSRKKRREKGAKTATERAVAENMPTWGENMKCKEQSKYQDKLGEVHAKIYHSYTSACWKPRECLKELIVRHSR